MNKELYKNKGALMNQSNLHYAKKPTKILGKRNRLLSRGSNTELNK
jgi:hypothetical protein